MNAGMINFYRRLISVSAGLLSIPLALFTLILFFTTGRPIPSSFIPADQLDFAVMPGDTSSFDPKDKPILIGTNSSRRCITLLNLSLMTTPSRFFDVADSESMQKIYSPNDRAGHAELSLGREYMVILNQHDIQVLKRAKDKGQYEEINGQWRGPKEPELWPEQLSDIAIDNRYLMICKESTAVSYDLNTGKKIGNFATKHNSRIVCGFFDSSGHPKSLVFAPSQGKTGRLEVVDHQTANPAFTLDQSKFRELEIDEEELTLANSRISPKKSLIATCLDPASVLLIRSLETGLMKSCFSIPADTRWLGAFSPDDRFFLFGAAKRSSSFGKVGEWSQKVKEWLERRFPHKKLGTLLDVQTGATWTDLIIGDRNIYTFTDDGSRLISYTPEGRYEYDLPPKWQYFTPWAWASLGAWLGLVAALWKLRGRQQKFPFVSQTA